MDIVLFTENLVKSITREPDLVKVEKFTENENDIILEIMVHESDMGVVIGKNGKMATSIRTIVQAYAHLNNIEKVKININSF